MLKYLKAEAEIIKFDNSDVVTASGDLVYSETCPFTPAGYVCWFLWLVVGGYFEGPKCKYGLGGKWSAEGKLEPSEQNGDVVTDDSLADF